MKKWSVLLLPTKYTIQYTNAKSEVPNNYIAGGVGFDM